MRSVVCRATGPVDDLVIEDADDLVAGPGQVVVDVEAAGVNYVDALFVQGGYQIKPQPPFVPGGEVAGTITAVGDGVEPARAAVGQRVIASLGLGGFASQVLARPHQLFAVPDCMTATQAAAFVQSYCTAQYSLIDRAGLAPGEWVLVLGAAGGVGRAAIDVATAAGAHVIAAASSAERVEQCLAAGADVGVDYSTEDLKARARALAVEGGSTSGGVDVVVDPVGGDRAEPALRSLGTDGRYLVIGFAGGDIPRLPLNQILLRSRKVIGVDWGAWMLGHGDEQRALLDGLLAMVGEGRLHPPEPTARPLDDAAGALTDLLEGKVTGKLVLVP
jgi:NADPH2:quinone reductase